MEQPAASSSADCAAIEVLARPVIEAAASAASPDELRRLLEPERAPARLRGRLLHVLLWRFLCEGCHPALTAVLHAGGKNWDARGRYSQHIITCKEEWLLLSHADVASSIVMMPACRAGTSEDTRRKAVACSLFRAGAPAAPIFERLRGDVWLYSQSDQSDIFATAQRALWWVDVLHLQAPARAAALLGQLHSALERRREARAAPLLEELSQLRVQLAGWRALRIAWIGAVVRGTHRP